MQIKFASLERHFFHKEGKPQRIDPNNETFPLFPPKFTSQFTLQISHLKYDTVNTLGSENSLLLLTKVEEKVNSHTSVAHKVALMSAYLWPSKPR